MQKKNEFSSIEKGIDTKKIFVLAIHVIFITRRYCLEKNGFCYNPYRINAGSIASAVKSGLNRNEAYKVTVPIASIGLQDQIIEHFEKVSRALEGVVYLQPLACKKIYEYISKVFV